MRCPQCHHDQVFPGAECERCGVIFARLRHANPEPIPTARPEEKPEEDQDVPGGQRIDASGRRAAAIGFGLAALTQFLPLLQMLIQYMVVLVHELGHAAAGWLFGFPSVPAFDFVYGGGVTSHTGRSSVVMVGMLGLAAAMLWRVRPHRSLFRIGLALLAAYLLLLAFGGDGAVIVAMGHGAELLFAGLFFYRALTGSGCHLEAERPLYAWLAWHIVFFDLRFAWRLATSGAERANYAAAKGGGHWMDFSRLANETFSMPLETVAVFFTLFCLVPLPLAWWLALRKRSVASTLPIP
ncbi:MAG: hypothetical protein JRH01_12090 [Deltaproteobacteria bacterium]|nr:hypothetical protein [Deltaproteobacteria bacterium]